MLNIKTITTGVIIFTVVSGAVISLIAPSSRASILPSPSFHLTGPDTITPGQHAVVTWNLYPRNAELNPFEEIELCYGTFFRNDCTTLLKSTLNDGEAAVFIPSNIDPSIGFGFIRLTAQAENKFLKFWLSTSRSTRILHDTPTPTIIPTVSPAPSPTTSPTPTAKPTISPTVSPSPTPTPPGTVCPMPNKCICIAVYDPVCGEDGKTYSSKCVAEYINGVKIAHDGACNVSTPSPTFQPPQPTFQPSQPTVTPTPIPQPQATPIPNFEDGQIGPASNCPAQRPGLPNIDPSLFQCMLLRRCGPPVCNTSFPKGDPRSCETVQPLQWMWHVPGTKRICPICLSPSTFISTPSGNQPVTILREGDLIYSQNKNGQKVIVPITLIDSTRVPATHELLEITLADSRAIKASPGHPTHNQGEALRDLKPGQRYDGSIIVGFKTIPTTHSYTIDILPASDTGTYWANNILVGSTLDQNQSPQ